MWTSTVHLAHFESPRKHHELLRPYPGIQLTHISVSEKRQNVALNHSWSFRISHLTRREAENFFPRKLCESSAPLPSVLIHHVESALINPFNEFHATLPDYSLPSSYRDVNLAPTISTGRSKSLFSCGNRLNYLRTVRVLRFERHSFINNSLRDAAFVVKKISSFLPSALGGGNKG